MSHSLPFLSLAILCYIKYVTSPKFILHAQTQGPGCKSIFKKCIVCIFSKIALSQHRIYVLHFIYPRNILLTQKLLVNQCQCSSELNQVTTTVLNGELNISQWSMMPSEGMMGRGNGKCYPSPTLSLSPSLSGQTSAGLGPILLSPIIKPTGRMRADTSWTRFLCFELAVGNEREAEVQH